MLLQPNMTLWRGRIDPEEGEGAAYIHQRVRPLEASAPPGVAVLGFACDEGVRRNKGRPGAKEGPAALRRALASLAHHGRRPLYDAGDVACRDGALETAQEELAQEVERLLRGDHLPLVLGGGHEVAYGSHLGLKRYLEAVAPGQTVGILNFDAHFDLRSHAVQASSGTPFGQLAELYRGQGSPFAYGCIGISKAGNTPALFDRAAQLGARFLLDSEAGSGDRGRVLEFLCLFMAGCDHLHLSIDLDVLPAATAPGVSAPAARGVPLEIIEAAVEEIQAAGRRGGAKLKLVDIAELSPAYDIDGRTARVGARLCHPLLCD